MSEHRFTAEVANRPDVAHAGLALLVDGYGRTVHLQGQAFQVEAFGTRLASHCDQYLVSLQLQQFTGRVTHLQALIVSIKTFDAVLQVEGDAKFLD
ncbi:hypothetical protein D3C80_1855100 [compost metagenome]